MPPWMFIGGALIRGRAFIRRFTVCKHVGDFSTVWSFFATSHGNSLCDRFGGTIKLLRG